MQNSDADMRPEAHVVKPFLFRWRWYIGILGVLLLAFIVDDLRGRAAWRSYHQDWSDVGVHLSLEPEHQRKVRAADDFWQSKLISQIEVRSPGFDRDIANVFRGEYRSGTIVKTACDWTAGVLSELNPPESVESFRAEDMTHEAFFTQLAKDCARSDVGHFVYDVPNIRGINDAARIAGDRAIGHIRAGDSQRAVRDLVAFIHFADHIQSVGLVGVLVDVAICDILRPAIYEVVGSGRLDDAQLQELQTALKEVKICTDFSKVGLSEMSWMTRSFSEDSIHAAMLEAYFFGSTPWYTALKDDPITAVMMIGSQGHHLQGMLDYYEMWHPVTSDRGSVPAELTIEQADRLEAWKPSLRVKTSLALMAKPNMGRICEKTLATQQFFDLAQVACALERSYLAEGAYPIKLEELSPSHLTDIPKDRFSAAAESIRYNPPKNGDGYQLAANGTDRKPDAANPLQDIVWKSPRIAP